MTRDAWRPKESRVLMYNPFSQSCAERTTSLRWWVTVFWKQRIVQNISSVCGEKQRKPHSAALSAMFPKYWSPPTKLSLASMRMTVNLAYFAPFFLSVPEIWDRPLSILSHNILTIRKEGKNASTKLTEYYYWFLVLILYQMVQAKAEKKVFGE